VSALLGEPEYSSPIDSVLGEWACTDKPKYLARAAASVKALTTRTFAAACAAIERDPGTDASMRSASAAPQPPVAAASASAAPPRATGKRARAASPRPAAAEALAADLCCPLTLTLFVDPWITSEGFVYERSALVDRITSGQVDPNTGSLLDLALCKPHLAVKVRADALRAKLTAQLGAAGPAGGSLLL
jgi:hypothetical protein